MRLALASEGIAEALGLALGVVPSELIYCSFGPGYGRSIVAAARLGVFDALGDEALDADELAARTGCDPLGLTVLCNALVGFRVLVKDGERWRHTKAGRTRLVAGREGSLIDAVLFMGYVQEWLHELEDAVRTGQVVRVHDREHPPEFWGSYLRALAAFANLAGAEIVRRVRMKPAPTRLLDVGGGHGVYSRLLCERYEGCEATVFDLPPACEAGRAITDHPRVRFREGDFRDGDWGGPYDAVLVFNVTHNATADEVQGLFASAFAALEPGGALWICDAAHRGRLGAAEGWNELFFFTISGARAWPEATLRQWAEAAGFRYEGLTRLMTAPNVLLRFRR